MNLFTLQDVLGGVVDGVIPLDDDSVGVVKDALAILACKEIKLSSLRRYGSNSQKIYIKLCTLPCTDLLFQYSTCTYCT